MLKKHNAVTSDNNFFKTKNDIVPNMLPEEKWFCACFNEFQSPQNLFRST